MFILRPWMILSHWSTFMRFLTKRNILDHKKREFLVLLKMHWMSSSLKLNIYYLLY